MNWGVMNAAIGLLAAYFAWADWNIPTQQFDCGMEVMLVVWCISEIGS